MPGDDDVDDTTNLEGGTPPSPPAPAPAPRVVGHGGAIPEERVSEIRRDSAAKERRRVLRELYGTDDEEEVKKIVATQKAAAEEAAQIKADREKARLAELSESERLKQELAAEKAARKEETDRLTRERDTHKAQLELERQEVQVTRLASPHIAPKFLKAAKVEFSEYVETLNKTQLAELDNDKIEKWFVSFAKKNPEFGHAKPAPVKTPEELASEAEAKRKAAAPAPRRAPVGAPRGSAPAVRPPAPAPRPAAGGPGTYKGKAVKDMTKQELREYTKSKGIKLGY